MIVVRLPVLLSPLIFALSAQAAPQFLWQGQVDGVAILRLEGKILTTQIQEGGPVERQKYHFNDPLPQTQQQVRLEVLEGRGYVHIIDQPNLENHYSVGVAIEDRQPGGAFYSIALYWDTSDVQFDRGEKTERVTWAGRVDQDAVVSCRQRTCVSSVEHGAPVAAERFKFTRPLPAREIQVRLEDPDGRGEIRLIEQPAQRNNYTARVSIRDPQPGSSDYSFSLAWNRVGKNEPPPIAEPAGRAFLWSGAVQGRVRVTIEGGASFSQPLDGGSVSGEHADMLRPLPERADLAPRIQKLRGRGRVSIIQPPSDKNHFRLIFEIDDPGPGTDNYEVELDW